MSHAFYKLWLDKQNTSKTNKEIGSYLTYIGI